MIGEMFAVGSSVTIALGIIVNKKLTSRIKALPLQTMRCWSGALFLLIALFVMGRGGDLIGISMTSMGLMVLSMLIGIALGDVLYLKSLSLTEATKMFPVVRGSQILSTGAIGALLFGEVVTVSLCLGAVLIVTGASLVTTTPNPDQSKTALSSPDGKRWLLFAAATGICWTLSFSIMKVVFKEIDPILGHAFRLPMAAVLLSGLSMGSGHGESLKIGKYGRLTICFIFLAGILGYGFGVLFSLYAMYFSGITRAAVLTSWTPVFIMFLAALFLDEKLTVRLGIGVVLCSIGTAIIVAS